MELISSKDCKVVICRDTQCKLCWTCNRTRNETSLESQAYIVFTCESKECRLCHEDMDILLDLFCPFNTAEEIAETERILKTIGKEATGDHDGNEKCLESKPRSHEGHPIQHHHKVNTTTEDIHVEEREKPPTIFGEIMEMNLMQVDDGLLKTMERQLQVEELKDLPDLVDIFDE